MQKKKKKKLLLSCQKAAGDPAPGCREPRPGGGVYSPRSALWCPRGPGGLGSCAYSACARSEPQTGPRISAGEGGSLAQSPLCIEPARKQQPRTPPWKFPSRETWGWGPVGGMGPRHLVGVSDQVCDVGHRTRLLVVREEGMVAANRGSRAVLVLDVVQKPGHIRHQESTGLPSLPPPWAPRSPHHLHRGPPDVGSNSQTGSPVSSHREEGQAATATLVLEERRNKRADRDGDPGTTGGFPRSLASQWLRR